MREVVIRNEKDTERLAAEIAQALQPGDVLALIGDLGTGKTTLTKYIAKGLGIRDMITSPTFTIVSEYKDGRLPLYHFDVYRLEGQDQVFETGVEEYFDMDGVCIIEWADMIAEILPDRTKCIFMEYGEEEGTRIYRCTF